MPQIHLDDDGTNAAARLADRASLALLTGQPHTASLLYELAALMAQTDEGARMLRVIAGEIRLGLLTCERTH